ncbi:InlB B-repeat-containing protein [Rubellicoccus peritrichatus]|uniref:InlB B-repeat-containing protein n=1 Tax=Rubellicoccus peritrichatus TaxID=3080537 RepID=A0AAQ3LD47_9BACT|nr:InlB B-repeat-containing protein [Puniceicoccus sp. CR14]WOO43520.1 InlB B-repeat-containing protein [Puniceicoccus sp. CR14]
MTFNLGAYGTLTTGDLVQSVVDDESAVEPVFAVSDGWTFLNWDNPYDNISEDIIITAQYVPTSLLGILEKKIIASDGAQNDNFSASVSMDGDTVVVGAHFDGGNTNTGSAYVFVRSGKDWIEQANLTASDAALGDQFGLGVSISGDTVIVGAHNNDDHGSNSGSVYVYTRSGTVWSEQQKLTASDASGYDEFGLFLDVCEDTVVVGVPDNDDHGDRSGSAYVFTRSGDVWTEQAKLTASDAVEYDLFGNTVSVSGDTLVVGAPGDDDGADASGSAYVFTRTDQVWTEQAKLTSSDAAERDYFGQSVSISGDTIISGAYFDDDDGDGSGSAYIFRRSGDVWTEEVKLTASDAAVRDFFGFSVDISGDTAVVGAYVDDDNGDGSGSAYLFHYSEGVWVEKAKLTASDGAAGDLLGQSVSISGNATVVSSKQDDDNGGNSGSAYIYEINVPPVNVIFDLADKGTRTGGGELVQLVQVATEVIPPDVDSIPGWYFNGWDVDLSSFDSDSTITAQYLPIYTVNFDLGDHGTRTGGGELTQTVPDGFAATEPVVEAANGYYFNGWDSDPSSITSDITLTAEYLNTHTVTFDLGAYGTLTSGELVQSIEEGGSAVEPVLSVSDGWAFFSWDQAYDNITGDVTITAQYVPASLLSHIIGQTTFEEKILADDGALNDNFGNAISVSGDTVVIGSAFDDDKGPNSGAAYVFIYSGGQWSQQAKLVPSDGNDYDLFGHSVSVSGDTVVAGAYNDRDENGYASGSAYVFVRSGNQWTEQTKLAPSDGDVNDQFGISVSVDGDNIAVGASNESNDNGSYAGSVYVFVRSGNLWTEQAKLTASDGTASDRFGFSVDLDGDTLVIGAYYDATNGLLSGSAYVFVRSGNQWSEEAKLTASDGDEYHYFGYSVGLSEDTVVIGAYATNSSTGSAYVYERSGNQWAERHILTASDGDYGDRFGGDVSIYGDVIAVGARGDDDDGYLTGSAYVYNRAGNDWQEVVKLTAHDASPSDLFGNSIAVSGERIVVSAHLDDDNGNSSGSAYIYSYTSSALLPATVTFDLAGKGTRTGGGELFQYVKQGTTALAPIVDEDPGWLLTGWDTDFSSVTSDLTVIAQYAQAHTVTFDLDGKGTRTGGGELSQTIQHGSSALAPSVSANTGLAFTGWDVAYDSVTSDLTVTAQYSPVVYTVTFDPDGKGTRSGGGELSQTVQHGSSALAPSVSANTGLAFTGWDVAYDSVTSDLTVTAQYSPVVYTVTFDLDGKGTRSGGGELSQTVQHGSSALAPSVSANADWYFTGWDVDFSSISGDLIVTALFVPGYMVTFDLGTYGSLLSGELVQKIPYGGTAIAPKFSVVNSWSFTGWDRSYHDITQAIVVTAQYAPSSLINLLENKVTADITDNSKFFGASISISGDTALVGASGILGYPSNDNGFAYVFVRNNGIWTQQAKLTASDGAVNDFFGASVSVHGDTAVVGSFYNDGSGSAYVYIRNTGVWTEQAKLADSNAVDGDWFGRSVSISGDTIVVGAPQSDENGYNSGEAHVFVREEGEWTHQARLIASDNTYNDKLGFSVCIDGDTIIVGASGDNSNRGSAHVFVRSGQVWSEQAKLTASDASSGDTFGTAVSINGDTVVVGAHQDDDNGTSSGSAYVFVRNNGNWSEQDKLIASDGAEYDHFGALVSIYCDKIAVGARYRDDNGSQSGGAYVYSRHGTEWSQLHKLNPSDGQADDHFGWAVSLDGDTLAIGAYHDDDVGADRGSAYFYDLAVHPVTVLFDLDGKGTRTGGGELSQTIQYGSAAVAPTVSPNTGWNFDGWDVTFDSVTGDLTVTAQYSPVVYTVTFDLGDEGTRTGGGELLQSVDHGTPAVAPTFDVDAAWSFSSWDVAFDSVTGDLTVTAQYSPILHTVTFGLDGKGSRSGGGELSQTVQYGTAALAPSVTADSGWYFTGWDVDFSSISGDLIVTALFVPGYTVTFDLGTYGSLLSGELVQTIPQGGTAKAPELSTADTWSFVGWDQDYNNVQSGITVTAQYAPSNLVSVLEENHVGSDAAEYDYFGTSVSICGDTALVGAIGDDDNGLSSGSAYVFVRVGNNWVEQAKLLPSDGARNNLFGHSVYVHGDTALVSASNKGTVYVFVRRDGVWTEQAKLTNSDDPFFNGFGNSVSLSGNTALIGAYGDFENGWESGRAYVFTRNGDVWTEQAKLLPSDIIAGDRFGAAVSVQGDTAFVGASSNSGTGSVYVFTRNSGAWTEQAKLVSSDGAIDDYFGRSISMSGDTALIGANGNDDGGISSGSAYIFEKVDNVWTEQAKLTLSDGADYDLLGVSVGLSGDFAIVGASGDDGIGSAYVYVRRDGLWSEKSKLQYNDSSTNAQFGFSVGLSGDTALVGARFNDDIDTSSGSVHFYDLGVPPVTVSFDLDGKGLRTGGGELSQVILYGTAASSPLVTPDTGWNFDGWDVAFDSVMGDLTVTAQYSPVTYTVTFDLGDEGTHTGGGELVQSVNHGTSAVAPTFDLDPAWSFSSWDLDFSSITGDLTITALYSPAIYTVTFDLDGNGSRTGGGELSQTISYGAAAVAPIVTPDTGWNFDGWDVAFDTVTGNLTVTAQYSPVVYTVTFNLGDEGTRTEGGALVQSVDHGTSAVVPVFNVDPAWSFTAWDQDFSSVLGDLTITAQYSPVVYAVIFDLDGKGTRIGGGELSQTVQYGTAALSPVIGVNTGWNFDRWDVAFGAIYGDLTVTAKYLPSMELFPAQESIAEDAGDLSFTLTAAFAPDTDISVSLTSSDTTSITVPETVTLLAGESSVSFNGSLLNDSKINGTRTSTITATVVDWVADSVEIEILDDEDLLLTVIIPETVSETDGILSVGWVTISGTLETDLHIDLVSDDVTEVVLPSSSITIPAGSTTASFDLEPQTDELPDGAQDVTITATASGFVSGYDTLSVKDSDLDHFQFDPITVDQTASIPFSVSIKAKAVDGITLSSFTGDVDLNAVGDSGSLIVSPNSVTFVNGVWSGSLSIAAVDTNVVLSANSGEKSGSSDPFILSHGALAYFDWSAISTTQYSEVPFSATVTAKDAYGFTVSSFSDTVGFDAYAEGGSPIVRILAFTANADLTREYPNTLTAISTFFTDYTVTTTNTGDAATLATLLEDTDVFLIPEQEKGSSSSYATAFASVLSTFVNSGGNIIVCTHGKDEHLFLTSSGLMNISTSGSTGSTSVRKIAEHPLTEGIANTFSNPYFNKFTTTDATVVVETLDGSFDVVFYREIGLGRAIVISTDYFTIDTDMDRILANAVRWGEYSEFLPISPSTSASFTDGVWTGDLVIDDTGSSVSLIAESSGGVTGTSALFDVLARPTYEVTFDLDGKGISVAGGELIQSVLHFDSAIEPIISALPAWSFDSWDVDFSSITNDLTVVAQYSPAIYTVTFDLDGKGTRTGGGELIQTVQYGTSAVAPTFNAAPDWRFDSWDTDFSTVTNDLTVTAVYLPRISMSVMPIVTTINAGENAVIKVIADVEGLTYQWYEGSSGDTSQPVPGANGNLLVSPALLESKSFWVQVSDGVKVVDSESSLVTVNVESYDLKAIGSNQYGQLGVLGYIATPTPVWSDVIQVSAGSNHTLVITSDGTLWGFGSNQYGQLGIGTTEHQRLPVFIASGVRKAVGGWRHSLFLKTDGTVWSMGDNNYGELGVNDAIHRHTPVQMASAVEDIEVGYNNSFFIKTDNSLWGCGFNSNGQLGDGTTENRLSPVLIASDVKKVAAGYDHTLFIKVDGTLWSMGDNYYGELGTGDKLDRSLPVQCASAVRDVAVGFTHSLFIKDDNTLWGMGSGSSGQLGNGSRLNRLNPILIASGVTQAEAYNHSSLFIKEDGTLWSMGFNFYGQLGDGTTLNRLTPVQIADDASLIASGQYYNLYVSNDGILKAFGLNSVGQLGTLDKAFRTDPVSVASDVISMSSGNRFTLLLKSDGTLWATGYNGYNQLGDGEGGVHKFTPILVSEGVAQMSAGANYTLFVKSDGTLWGIGYNLNGELGNGTTDTGFRSAPMQIASHVAKVDAANSHSLFIRTDGTLWAMGSNTNSQIGYGLPTKSLTPVQIETNVIEISAGLSNSLFIKSDQSLWGVGSNSSGQLGDGTRIRRDMPIEIASNVKKAISGYGHNLFIKTDDTLWGMGDNESGELGDGTTTRKTVPIKVAENVADASTYYSHSLFVKNDQTLWAMGGNIYGQLGDGTTTDRLSPVQVATDVVALEAGYWHSMFLQKPGTYSVYFNLAAHGTRSGGGELIQTLKTGSDAIAPTVAVSDGWVFAGWDTDFSSVSNDLTVTAQYNPVLYTVTFDLGTYSTRTGGGELSQTIGHGSAAFTPTFNVDPGWNFTGWDIDFSSVTSDLTVTAQYSPVTYTVTFDLGAYGTRTGGGELSQSIQHGNAAVAPTFDVAGGWQFSGWDIDFSLVTSNSTVTAQYTPTFYTVTFDLGAYGMRTGGGELIQSIANEEAAVAPSFDVTSGWHFSGWDTTFDLVNSDMTITAQYLPVHTVTFDLDGKASRIGGGTLTQSVVDGLGAIQPSLMVDPGWAFDSWDVDFSFVQSDLTVTAQYISGHMVIFDLGTRGSLLNGKLVQVVPTGSTAIAPEISVEEGWDFIGWDRSYGNVGENISVTAQYLPESDVGVSEYKILSPESLTGRFPTSVAICGDTLVTGYIEGSGRVLVYTREGSDWVLQAELFSNDYNSYFGTAVAIYGDTLAIGQPAFNSNVGAVHLYQRLGTTWSFVQRLTPSDAPGYSNFGTSVSLHGDILAVGAPTGSSSLGAAYIFNRSDDAWSEIQKIVVEDASNYSSFGQSLSLYEETLLVGAPNDDVDGSELGSAYIFRLEEGIWNQQTKLVADDGEDYDLFGRSVSLSSTTAICASYNKDLVSGSSGATYVFERDGEGWDFETKLVAVDMEHIPPDSFTVALNGNTIVMGAPGDDRNGDSAGSVYTYRRGNVGWELADSYLSSDGVQHDLFGVFVAVSGDIVVSAATGDGSNGSVYALDIGTELMSVTFDLDGKGTHSGGADLIQRVAKGMAADSPEVAALDGWFFDGWDTDISSITTNLLVTARYLPTSTVSFELGTKGSLYQGDLVQDIALGYGAVEPMVEVNPGWYLSGWDVDFSDISGDLLVSAQYAETLTVNFNLGTHGSLNAGQLVQELRPNEGAIPPSINVSDGWSFVGWDNSFDSVTEDTIVNALYAPANLTSVVRSRVLPDSTTDLKSFGQSISVDGDLAAVYSDGAVHIYYRVNESWELETIIRDDSEPGSFRASVSISGYTLVVGASEYDEDFGALGSAYVYVRQNGNWSKQAELRPDGDAQYGDFFGFALALEDDRVVVGARSGAENGVRTGNAYVFVRKGDFWAQESKLLADDGTSGDQFGSAIAISGNRIVIGAKYKDVSNRWDAGSAYVFVLQNGSWTQEQKLVASDYHFGDDFGYSVAIDGDDILIGATSTDGPLENSTGAAYFFQNSGSSWSEQAKLTASDGERFDWFGVAVDLHGSNSLVGAYSDELVTSGRGSAYLYRSESGGWYEEKFIPESEGGIWDNNFGGSVAISNDTILIAAHPHEVSRDKGAVYFYDLGISPATVTFDLGGNANRIGGGELVQQVRFETAALTPIVEPNPGWNFIGWDVDFSSVTSDLTVTAQYSPVLYTVTFDLGAYGTRTGGGELSQSIQYGNAAVAPTFDVAGGWFFSGWSLDFSAVTGDILVSANYVTSHTVTFDLGPYASLTNGQLLQQVASGSGAVEPEFMVDDGRIFTGWDADFSNVTEDLTITAQVYESSLIHYDHAKLLAGDGRSDDNFGYDVSIDGDTAVIGARYDNSAYVYVKMGDTWVQEAKLLPTYPGGNNGDYFGESVAISGDTIIVGAPGQDLGYEDGGCAYIYVRSEGSWVFEKRITPGFRRDHNYLGRDVAIHGDTAVIGAPGTDAPSLNSGCVYIYVRSDGIWDLQNTLIPDHTYVNEFFGSSLSIEGDTLVVGAPGDYKDESNIPTYRSMGSVSVFTRSGSTWSLTRRLLSDDPWYDNYFGHDVDIDQGVIVVGEHRVDEQDGQGVVHVFGSGSGYRTKLLPDDPVSRHAFGVSLELSGDKLVIGTLGYAYLFVLKSNRWVEIQKFSVGTNVGFGRSVALDGDDLIFGTPYADDLGENSGSAYYYDISAPNPPINVTFAIGDNGIRTGGGELTQLVKVGSTAIEPIVTPNPGWTFIGWDLSYTNVTSDLTVTAQYERLYTVTFDLGSHGVRTGGGELTQYIIDSNTAFAPVIEVDPSWIFTGWDLDFSVVTTDMNVTAEYLSRHKQFGYVEHASHIEITYYPDNATRKIVIPKEINGNPVTSIGANIFNGLDGIKSIVIPASVDSIAGGAFANMPNLVSIYFHGDAPSVGLDSFLNTTATVYYFSDKTGFTSPTWQGLTSESMGVRKPAKVWLTDHGLSHDEDLSSDPMGNGVALLTPYALNLPPSMKGMPEPEISDSELSSTFYTGRDDVTYTIETSTDMINWTSTGVTLEDPDGDGYSKVKVAKDGTVRFIRITVSQD